MKGNACQKRRVIVFRLLERGKERLAEEHESFSMSRRLRASESERLKSGVTLPDLVVADAAEKQAHMQKHTSGGSGLSQRSYVSRLNALNSMMKRFALGIVNVYVQPTV